MRPRSMLDILGAEEAAFLGLQVLASLDCMNTAASKALGILGPVSGLGLPWSASSPLLLSGCVVTLAHI